MTKKADKKTRKWTYAAKALDQMIARGVDPATAQKALAEALRLGKIRTRSRRHWISEIEGFNKAWREPIAPITEKKRLQKKVWRPLQNISEDRLRWRWRTSCFHTTLRESPVKRRMMEGVQFRVEDLQAIFPNEFGKSPKARKHGPGPELARRDLAWKTVVEIALRGELTSQELENQTGLEMEMRTQVTFQSGAKKDTQGVGNKKIAEVARQVWPLVEAVENDDINTE